MRYVLSLALLILASCVDAYSQRNAVPDKSDYYSFGENFYSAAYSFPAANPDSMTVVVLYKVRYAGLNFVKNTNRPDRGLFVADFSTEASLRDSEGIIRRRLLSADSVYVSSYEETNSKTEYITDFMTAVVPNDSFKVSISVYDKNTQKFQKVDYPLNPIKSGAISRPIFSGEYGTAFSPYVLNFNLPFQFEQTNIIFFADGTDEGDVYRYSIKAADSANESARGEFTSIRGNEPKFSIDSRGRLTMTLNQNPKLTDRIKAYNADLDYRKFKTGKYTLNIWKQGSRDTSKTDFSVVWGDEPLSIKNTTYALGLMRLILKEDEHDKLSEGDEDEVRQKIYSYWKKKDPTPETEYNEAMAEFFRRADYAHFNYQTLTERDGAKTDRGKVYIFYGPPDNVTHDLVEGRTRETWLYRKLNKEFSFETVSIGVVKLSQIKQ